MAKVIRNSIKCVACGHEMESIHRHDYREHECKVGVCQRWRWDDKECTTGHYEPGPLYLMVDGGHDYIRHGFCCREHWEASNTSVGE